MLRQIRTIQTLFRLRRLMLTAFLTFQALILFYDLFLGLRLSTVWDEALLLLSALNPVIYFQKCPYCGRRLTRREIMAMDQFFCPYCRNNDLHPILPISKPERLPWPPKSVSAAAGRNQLWGFVRECSAYCAVSTALFLLILRPSPGLPAWLILLFFALLSWTANSAARRDSHIQ